MGDLLNVDFAYEQQVRADIRAAENAPDLLTCHHCGSMLFQVTDMSVICAVCDWEVCFDEFSPLFGPDDYDDGDGA